MIPDVSLPVINSGFFTEKKSQKWLTFSWLCDFCWSNEFWPITEATAHARVWLLESTWARLQGGLIASPVMYISALCVLGSFDPTFHIDVAHLFTSEESIIFQNYIICVPDDYSQFITDQREKKIEVISFQSLHWHEYCHSLNYCIHGKINRGSFHYLSENLAHITECTSPGWLPGWNDNLRSRSRHVHGEHIHPHFQFTLENHPTMNLRLSWIIEGSILTCSMPGLSGWYRGLVSTCSGTRGHPTLGISSQCWSTARAKCSSLVFLASVKKCKISLIWFIRCRFGTIQAKASVSIIHHSALAQFASQWPSRVTSIHNGQLVHCVADHPWCPLLGSGMTTCSGRLHCLWSWSLRLANRYIWHWVRLPPIHVWLQTWRFALHNLYPVSISFCMPNKLC